MLNPVSGISNKISSLTEADNITASKDINDQRSSERVDINLENWIQGAKAFVIRKRRSQDGGNNGTTQGSDITGKRRNAIREAALKELY